MTNKTKKLSDNKNDKFVKRTIFLPNNSYTQNLKKKSLLSWYNRFKIFNKINMPYILLNKNLIFIQVCAVIGGNFSKYKKFNL